MNNSVQQNNECAAPPPNSIKIATFIGVGILFLIGFISMFYPDIPSTPFIAPGFILATLPKAYRLSRVEKSVTSLSIVIVGSIFMFVFFKTEYLMVYFMSLFTVLFVCFQHYASLEKLSKASKHDD